MIDKQQPPPERVYLSRFWANYIEHSCQFSYEQKQADDIEYARVQPVDDGRVGEIARWMDRHTTRNSNAYADLSRAFSEIRYLLSLLP